MRPLGLKKLSSLKNCRAVAAGQAFGSPLTTSCKTHIKHDNNMNKQKRTHILFRKQ